MDTERKIAPAPAPSPRLMSLRDAAGALGVSDRFLRQLEARGQVRFTRLGRRVLLRVTEVERLAADGAR
jgi:excisionase family DNA binding protein